MEIVITQRLRQHLGMCNILTSEQYGFRERVSTNDDIYKLINSVYEAWNSKLYMACIFCDMTIWNTRRQRVSLEYRATHCYKSDCESMKCIVPQGSVLDPVLFKMYINELQKIMGKLSHTILYADDTNIIVQPTNYYDLQKK
jgi:hypothetical protein